MDEGFALTLILILCVIAAVLCLRLYHYYKEYQDLRYTRWKWVVLRDFDGHFKRIGVHADFGTKNDHVTIIVRPSPRADYYEEWEIDSPFAYESVTREYKALDYWELTIFADFAKSDFKQRKIVPLFDMDILKLGLTRGVRAIKDRANKLIQRIEELEESLVLTEQELLETQKSLHKKRLKYLKDSRSSFTILLNEMDNEVIIAPKLLAAKILNERQKYINELLQFAKDPKTLTKLFQEVLETQKTNGDLPRVPPSPFPSTPPPPSPSVKKTTKTESQSE
ncbi:MAG: hypothetical protein JRI56_00870 [Deltaproteobacteria bacterium]|nr:hypothetical protein [Deltaproteobacteria bacterium]